MLVYKKIENAERANDLCLDLVLQCVLTGVECWLCIICVFTFPLTPFRYKVVFEISLEIVLWFLSFENVSNTKRRQRGRRKSKRFNKQNNNSARSAHLFVQFPCRPCMTRTWRFLVQRRWRFRCLRVAVTKSVYLYVETNVKYNLSSGKMLAVYLIILAFA